MKKNLLVIIVLVLLGCSSDDENQENQPQTFLEIYEGTVWGLVDNDTTLHTRFINSDVDFTERWIKEMDEDCFYYSSINNNDVIEFDNVEYGIIENSGNIFKYYTYDVGNEGSEFEQFITYSISGDTLQFSLEVFVDGQLDFNYVNIWSRQDVDVDALIVCN
jgi:hypothetical protein